MPVHAIRDSDPVTAFEFAAAKSTPKPSDASSTPASGQSGLPGLAVPPHAAVVNQCDGEFTLAVVKLKFKPSNVTPTPDTTPNGANGLGVLTLARAGRSSATVNTLVEVSMRCR